MLGREINPSLWVRLGACNVVVLGRGRGQLGGPVLASCSAAAVLKFFVSFE